MLNSAALSGLRVIEYGENISGPYCTRLMADLGAEVIKIERPGTGDRTRSLGPFPNDEPHPERSGLFMYLNMNKKGVTLDLTTPTGVKLFKELIRDSDVLVENYPPGTMARLGLFYDTLREINKKLIMVSISPFGQYGAYHGYKGTELITFHMSGLAYETPRATERIGPDRPPLKGGAYFAESFAAVNAAGAVACALFARRRDGLGQHIDISAQESLIPLLRRPVAIYLFEGKIASRLMYTWKVAPHHFMRCKDGYIYASVVEEHQWTRLLEVLGNPEWGNDPRFAEGPSRLHHWDVLEPLLSAWLMERTKAQVLAEMQANGVPFAPVSTAEDVVGSPQLSEREFFQAVEHPDVGQILMPGAPYKFSDTPAEFRRLAPRLGEHNEEIFCDQLGYSKQQAVKLRETGII